MNHRGEEGERARLMSFVNIHWVLAVALVPLLLAGAFVLATKAHGLARYDATYFTEAHGERYDSPGAVARALEAALQTDDRVLMAELQGLRRPAVFAASPDMILVMLWERGHRYFTYMYLDMHELERHPHYVEQVKGRWVVAPSDAYYYLHSGDWLKVAVPVAIIWWLVGIVVILVMWVFHLSARLRGEMYGR